MIVLPCPLALSDYGVALLYSQVTTGAADDLRKVTQMVYMMLGQYGMGEGIGQLAFPRQESQGFPEERWVFVSWEGDGGWGMGEVLDGGVLRFDHCNIMDD